MNATIAFERDNLVVDFGALVSRVSDEEFSEFCRLNPELRIERTSQGDLIIMPPTGGLTGAQNFELIGQFRVWVKHSGTGKGFDSSTVFSLPNGAKRSPDLSWVSNESWQALTPEEQAEFPPLCPDFVVELRSRTDALKNLKAKMEEYLENGARLGWIIDPIDRKFYVYRPGMTLQVLDNPQTVSGTPLLKGFVLDVRSLWE